MTNLAVQHAPRQSFHAISNNIDKIDRPAKCTLDYPPRWFVFIRNCIYTFVVCVLILSIEPILDAVMFPMIPHPQEMIETAQGGF